MILLTDEDRKKTDKIISELIGTYDDFIFTNVQLQNRTNSFKEMTDKEKKRAYDKAHWHNMTPEKREANRAKDRENRRIKAEQQMEERKRRAMLGDFLRAKTPAEKREVIKGFNSFYYVFGNKLDPKPQYQLNQGETND